MAAPAVDITRGLLRKLDGLDEKVDVLHSQGEFPHTSADCTEVVNTSFALFKETNVSSELSSADANTLISLVMELSKRYQALKSFELIVEAWKFYMKILKVHSEMLTVNTCDEVSSILSKSVSEGIMTFIAQPSDSGLSFLFFYLQRMSATLSYCSHKISEARSLDMIYLLCAARGVLELPMASNSKLSAEMKGKMELNFMKAMTSPNEVNETRYTSETLIFRRAMNTGQFQSAWSFLPNLSLCRSIGSCRLMLFASNQSHHHFCPNAAFLETLIALLADACRSHFQATLSDSTFRSIINDIARKYSITLCNSNHIPISNKGNNKELIIDLLTSYQKVNGNCPNLQSLIYELTLSSIVRRLDEDSQRSILSICQKLIRSNPSSVWFTLFKSFLLTVRTHVSSDVISRYALEASSSFSNLHERFISSCMHESNASVFVDTVNSSLETIDSSKSGDFVGQLFVQLKASNHFPENARKKIKIRNIEDLQQKAAVLSDFLASSTHRIKAGNPSLYSVTRQRNIPCSRCPNELCSSDMLIALDTLYTITMAISHQSTITSSEDKKIFVDDIIETCKVLADICTMCVAYVNNVESSIRHSPDPSHIGIRDELKICIKTSILVCNYFRNILMSIVRSNFEDSHFQRLKMIFEVFSNNLFTQTACTDETTVEINVLPMDIDSLRLHISFLDCCYEFAENLQPALQANAASLFTAQTLSIIKVRNKERRGKCENIFLKCPPAVQQKIITTVCANAAT